MMVDRGFLLRGRVQGVGFRWWTRQTAEQLGVVGTVKNLRDGSVEVMARAEAEAMERFAHRLRQGPPSARVDEVEEIEAALPDQAGSFHIER